jgi:hypothetical protein
MARSSREVTADAIREIDTRLGSIETMLADIRRIVVHLSDGQNEHRSHVQDQFDRLGTRVHHLERLASNGGHNGGE